MIGLRLKKLRAERNISQKQLATLSGVSNVQIANYERGKANPSPQIVNKLASALNVSVDYFYDLDTDWDILFDQKQFEKALEKLKAFSPSNKLLVSRLIDKLALVDMLEKAHNK